jgi:hypothetical protein
VALKGLTLFGIGNKTNCPPKYVSIKQFYDHKRTLFAFFNVFNLPSLNDLLVVRIKDKAKHRSCI